MDALFEKDKNQESKTQLEYISFRYNEFSIEGS